MTLSEVTQAMMRSMAVRAMTFSKAAKVTTP
jgi:hypothetical protein